MANFKHDFIKVIHAFIILDIFAVYILRFTKLKLCGYLGQQSSFGQKYCTTHTNSTGLEPPDDRANISIIAKNRHIVILVYYMRNMLTSPCAQIC